MLALLLEKVGADKAVRIGTPEIWRAAVAGLSDPRDNQKHQPPVALLPEAERHGLEAALLSNAHAQHEELKQLLDASSDHWGFEDSVYRFYHQSFKVFWLQQRTDCLLSDRPLHPWFLEIVRRGTVKEFATSDNDRWTSWRGPSSRRFFTRGSFSRWPSVMPSWRLLRDRCQAVTPHCCTCINSDDSRRPGLAALTAFRRMIET
jgi:hypothetical protein